MGGLEPTPLLLEFRERAVHRCDRFKAFQLNKDGEGLRVGNDRSFCRFWGQSTVPTPGHDLKRSYLKTLAGLNMSWQARCPSRPLLTADHGKEVLA